jgi:hypothetical protein
MAHDVAGLSLGKWREPDSDRAHAPFSPVWQGRTDVIPDAPLGKTDVSVSLKLDVPDFVVSDAGNAIGIHRLRQCINLRWGQIIQGKRSA